MVDVHGPDDTRGTRPQRRRYGLKYLNLGFSPSLEPRHRHLTRIKHTPAPGLSPPVQKRPFKRQNSTAARLRVHIGISDICWRNNGGRA